MVAKAFSIQICYNDHILNSRPLDIGTKRNERNEKANEQNNLFYCMIIGPRCFMITVISSEFGLHVKEDAFPSIYALDYFMKKRKLFDEH